MAERDAADPNETAAAGESLSRKHAAMLERLSARHHSRTSAAKPEPNPSSSFESTQSFLSQFSQSKHSIESRLSRIRQNPDPSLKPDLEAVSVEISSLEKLVAENSYLLPPYELRTCLGAVSDLRQSAEDAAALIVPRKKFSFKNKGFKKPGSVGLEEKGFGGFVNAGPGSITGREDAVLGDEKMDVGLRKKGLSGFLNAGPGFRDREDEVLVREFKGSEFKGRDGEFTLSGLRGCEVRLKGCFRALFVDELVDCKVYVGAVMGSVLIEGAERCVFVFASHQIRIHSAKSCDFYLRVRSRPIIEDSSGVRFGPYCLSYRGIEKDLEEANLGEEMGNWANVDDFRWLRAVQSPNWSLLKENERMGIVEILNEGNVD